MPKFRLYLFTRLKDIAQKTGPENLTPIVDFSAVKVAKGFDLHFQELISVQLEAYTLSTFLLFEQSLLIFRLTKTSKFFT